MVATRRLRLSLITIVILAVGFPPIARPSEKSDRLARVKAAGTVGKYPPRPWEKAFVYKNKSYLVRTNTSPEVASYIGQLMNFAQKRYRTIFNFDEEIPRLEINAYRTREEFEKVAAAVGLADSGGFFMQQGSVNAIYLPYTSSPGNPLQPTTTLLHEGTHQFVSIALDFKIPKGYAKYFQDNITTLKSVPLWLNEGLATYMEVSRYDGEKLVVGEINKDRLLDLQQRLRHDSYVPLAVLFQTASPYAFTAAHYSSAWGVVYWFLHDANPKIQKKKRAILAAYIRACRNGFMEEPRSEFKKFLKDDFNQLWQQHIREKSQEIFIDLTVGKNGSLKKWEKLWKQWILKLNPKDPYGGLRKK